MIVLNVFIGFFVSHFIAGKKVGERGRIPSFRFRVKDKYIVHLHHWFLCGVALASLSIIDLYNTILYGLLMGSAIQGLTYKDFYKLIYRHTEKAEEPSA
ncbi:MAG: hypothetical protein COU47_01130 [Candidatus Niyogibacteria bacterium CG10_big_fil_rev_8_21_14_0_10_46_36]|uniref:Uncharacterized protein n=1 Tax=Candidatus Niyogibacteria bacterium CG10_big_fil_rev_8_21_14_0_10_46_36 TaxID=1974726 RepID=A0A2H0TDN6_9BACT|nr:MAG: hypothetical protein COU47_01130 [Candidatus Niyogibacteria bacterium CG10_big_fil_rev_8_21_14_0_10_46_36]